MATTAPAAPTTLLNTEEPNATTQPAATTETTNTAPAEADKSPEPKSTDAPSTDASGAGDSEPDSKQPIAEDWDAMRTRLAKGDDKLLKRLSRYSTLDEYIRAGYEAQNKLSSIKANSAPGKDATPEEIAEYRKANGIPEEATGYDVALPDGLVLGENDRPIAEKFMSVAHRNNLPNAVVNDIIAEHLRVQEDIVAQQQEADAQMYEQTLETLRSPDVWGSEFVKNRNMVINLLNEAPPGVGDLIQGARLPDGSALANNAEVLVWLNSLARKVNPTATLTDGNRSMPTDQIENEMAQLTKMMGDSNSEYWKGPLAEKHQNRYRELVTALQGANR